MLWISHVSTALFMSNLLGAKDLLSLSLSCLGSIFPDRIEFLGSRRILKHRQISHSIVVWIFLFLEFSDLSEKIKWFFFGVFVHLFEDLLTKRGIPLFLKKRIAIKLVRTGGISEFIFTTSVLISCLFIYLRNSFS